ncbi:MAG: holo-ACP synthase [Gemmatimonadaceae bacterium]|nr:holo-ACP synthase [Gemmatimonadaceae bacterium]
MILGVGIDLVDVARAERMLAQKGERALARLCTEREGDYVRAHPAGAASFAARLAAKEAAYKALAGSEEARGMGWRDVEVERASDGRPTLLLTGKALSRANTLGVKRVHVSLTHTHTSAAAVVILEG